MPGSGQQQQHTPSLSKASSSGSIQDESLASSSAPSCQTSAKNGRTTRKDSKDKPLTDVIAGALARAGSQSTIHPLDTLKVRMQAGKSMTSTGSHLQTGATGGIGISKIRQAIVAVSSLYRGVFGAASGAGIIIGSYFAFYSNAKNLLRDHTDLPETSVAFVAGASAAVGSSVVKVPLAVCIRSVQAGVYANFWDAATTIVSKVGVRGLFTGFLPTLLEDVPDMAVKFAVYESLRTVHTGLTGHSPSVWEDLLMGGTAGAAAAAATTPLDVVKTRMMCSASERPTIVQAAKGVLASGKGGWRTFFTGVGPRSLSNGLNSAIFFCFFEAIRKSIHTWQAEQQAAAADEEREAARLQSHGHSSNSSNSSSTRGKGNSGSDGRSGQPPAVAACVSAGMVLKKGQGGALGSRALDEQRGFGWQQNGGSSSGGGGGGRMACLSLALPLPLGSRCF